MKKIFVCSPLRGNLKGNQKNATQYAKFIYQRGYLPIYTHVYFDLFAKELKDDKKKDRRKILSMGYSLLKDCDEMWIFGDISEGMKKEMLFCKRHKIGIKFVR